MPSALDRDDHERLLQLLEHSPAVAIIWRTIPGWPVQFVSRSIESWGYRREELLSGNLLYVDLVHPDDLDRVNAEIAGYFAHGPDTYTQEYRLRRADGHWLWIEDYTWLKRNEDGDVVAAYGFLWDVTDRHQLARDNNRALQREARVQSARAAVMSSLLSGRNIETVMAKLAQHLETILPGTCILIRLSSRQTGALRPVAAPSLTAAALEAVGVVTLGGTGGPCLQAALRGEAVIVDDLATMLTECSNLQALLDAGIKACWSQPFHGVANDLLGILTVYHVEPTGPTPNEVALLREFAQLAALAVQQVRSNQHAALVTAIFDSTQEGILITDAEGIIVNTNPAALELTGFMRSELVGHRSSMLRGGQHDEAFYAALWANLRAHGCWRGEMWCRRKSGTVFLSQQTVSTLRTPEDLVEYYVCLFSDVTVQRRYQRELERFAHFDPLTQLPNRILFTDRLASAMASARRTGDMLAVIFVDLDGFKAVNDEFGHAVGDELLVQIAQRVVAQLRETDTLARLGGDEFVGLLMQISAPEAVDDIIERILAAVAVPLERDDCKLLVSASIGVSFYPQLEELNPEQLIRQADRAMYLAKAAGKNQACRWH
jgi:diguanylate cyclase (GGDEF)-like protein/PAS domain S-box-containing protein